jgi:hypothetical protein
LSYPILFQIDIGGRALAYLNSLNRQTHYNILTFQIFLLGAYASYKVIKWSRTDN